MRITARYLTAYSPLQVKLDIIHMVKSRINQNTAFAEGIIRRCMSAGDYDFLPASFVFIDTGEKKADNQAADNAARLLITLNHYYMSQDVRIQNEYFISQLYRQIDYYMNQLRLNSRTEFRELNRIYKQIQDFEIYADQKKPQQDHADILDRQLERILLFVENRENERQRTILLSEKRLLNRENGGRTEKTKSLSLPFYRMIGQVLQSSKVNDYKTIWRQSVSRQYSLEAREFLNYLEHLNVSERNSVLEMLGEEEYSLYGKLRKMERGQWRNFAGQMAGRIEKSLLTARETGDQAIGQAAGGADSLTPAQILESTIEPENWLSFIEEIHKSTSLEEEFYKYFQENKRSFTTFEKNRDILENRDLILKNEFFRLLEQTEESEDVEQIWNLAGLDHVLKESSKEWRNYEAKTLSEKKEQIKEWISYMDSSLWERFLTLLLTKKELEALTEESYQYSQMVKSGQMKQHVKQPGKQIFERDQWADEQLLAREQQAVGQVLVRDLQTVEGVQEREQVLIREQQSVMEYLRRESFQHTDTDSAEWKELSQVFWGKLLEKENVGIDSVNSELVKSESVNSKAWFSFIEEIHESTSLEKEFYSFLQENRRSFTTFEKNSDSLEKQNLILKNEFFRLLEQMDESEDVEQIWNLTGLDHVLMESAEEWRNYEAETLSEKKEQIKEWMGYLDSSLWERFLTLFSTKKELEALTEESYHYSQMVKSGQMKQPVERLSKQSLERERCADEQVLVEEPQVGEQVLAREQQAVMEYLCGEYFQHIDTYSVEGKELSQIFAEKFLRKENTETESVNSEAWFSFIEEIHKNTSLEKEFYNSLQENRRSFTTFEKNLDSLEKQDLILKNEFFRLLEQTEESEDVEQIWNLAGLDHVLKESSKEWRSYEAETLSEKKEQIKEWVGYMDSSLWERFLTLFLTKKELEALTEESYQYSQMLKSDQMKQPVERPDKQIFERDRWTDEQIFVGEPQVHRQVLAREQLAVIEYLRRENFQHMVLDSVEGNELSQIFTEKFLGKENIETEPVKSESVKSEEWLSFIEKIHREISLEKEFYNSLQENRRSFTTFEKNPDILEKQDLILKNEFFHLLEQMEESEDVEQTRLLHLLENLSYEESAKIYSRLDVKKLFDGAEQGNKAQEPSVPNEILAQTRLLETEQGAESEIFLVQLLQKSLYEKEEEKLREQKMLWSSTVTALYQDENLAHKAEVMRIPEWSEWDFPSANVQMDFYERRLLRLLKQMTEEELIHLYELQKTVMAAQAVNNMLTVMKSDSLPYSRREELWKTIADAVYHNSYFSEKMKQTQEMERTTSIEPSTRLSGEMVHQYAESSMIIEETADRVLALLKSEPPEKSFSEKIFSENGFSENSVPETNFPEARQSAADVMPVWNLVMTKNGRLIQENIQENGELVNRWLPKQLLHIGEERHETPDYGPVSLVPGHPSAQAAPGIVQTPQMPIDIETRIEKTVKERVKDINFITRRDSEVTVSKEYETKIKTLSDQVALQRQEIEEIKTGSQKLLQNTDTRKIANTVMKQLQDQLRAERLRKGL